MRSSSKGILSAASLWTGLKAVTQSLSKGILSAASLWMPAQSLSKEAFAGPRQRIMGGLEEHRHACIVRT
jgi:hypothetical protein